MYHNLSLINSTFNNVLCNGDGDDSSLITFISSPYNNYLDFQNVIIRDSHTNGDLIKINGDMSIINFFNVTVYNVLSYGTIINDKSLESVITVKNSHFIENKNLNKQKCGLISCTNKINLNINNTNIKNNNIKNNGGAFLNGGSVYFQKTSDIELNHSIKIIDTQFKNNKAEYFGGAIYSDFVGLNNLNTKNVTFIGNHAYAGGAIYSNKNCNKALFSKNTMYINNTAESHGKDFATSPYIVNFKQSELKNYIVTSGELFPLQFNLTDEFGQIIQDVSKYYSNIILTLTPIINDDEIILIYGNSCYFLKGNCELNNFRVFTSSPTKLNFKINIENTSNIIKINNNIEYLNFTINDCTNEQYKIYQKSGQYKYNVYHCENPICNENCPTQNNTAICIKGNNENINSIKNNKCQCTNGWKGDKCNIMDIIDNNLSFNNFSSYSSCSIKFIFKHCGIVLIYYQFLIYVSTGYELGININDFDIIDKIPIQNQKVLNRISKFLNGIKGEQIQDDLQEEKTVIFGETIINNIENELNRFNDERSTQKENKINTSKFILLNIENDNPHDLIKLNKCIKIIHSLHMELISIIIISILLIIGIVIYNSKNEIEYIQEYNGKWRYECPLDHYNIILNLTEAIIILYLIVISLKVLNYVYIFKCVKYIGYSSLLWIATGPLTSVIIFL
ncbi:hypothetical protein PIROE2DRAFT_13403 [Piromyces sp. E2]|nr:hypothetical protein PIROE2DRAFT_13403 [Piromyces sp. E2]|eukprot:OUM60765.1 hypothetical protein PIROE2DRAFT_13403 [Piromyces sp. E2]